MIGAGKTGVQPSDNLRRHYEDFERRRQLLILYLFNGFSGLFLFVFGIGSAFAGRKVLVFVLFSLGLLSVCNILILKFTGKQHIPKFTIDFGVLLLITYLLGSGGVNNTGPLWCYPALAATFLINGAQRGGPLVTIMFVIMIVVFYVPVHGIEFAVYASDFKLRFLSTFGALALFVALHEFARAKNQEELLRLSGQLDQLSYTDQLTALPNRRYMVDRLEAENSRYLRHGHSYSILYGDIDDFKAINDQCGHHTGDSVLQTIAQKIRAAVRQHDEVCRWGGEEFLILLPETDQALAKEVAEKLRTTIAQIEFKHGNAMLHLTVSIGVHTVDCQGNIDAFIQLADRKLYIAKHGGKNRVVTDLQEV